MLDQLNGFFFGTEPIEAVQQLVGLGHQDLMMAFSVLADTWGIIFVVGLTLWLWGRRATYSLLGVVALSALTKVMMTKAFSISRPHGPEIVSYTDLKIGSFPSGHVYQVFTAWFWLYVRGHLSWILPLAIAGVVAFSRLYLAAHYVGDVLFAIPFGLLFIWGYSYLWPWMKDHLQRRSYLFYLLLGVAATAAVGATLLLQSSGTPRRWEILGITIGLTAGLLLEDRYVRYQAGALTKRQKALEAVAGTVGILVCYGVDRLIFAPEAHLPGVFTAGAATLWAVFGIPALGVRWAEKAKSGSTIL